MGENGFIPIPSGLASFSMPDGAKFQLDLVAASRELNRIAKEHENSTNGEHLEPWITWIAQKTGVQLIQAQADWLWEFIHLKRSEAKQDFFTKLKSLNSTELTPAAGIPDDSSATT